MPKKECIELYWQPMNGMRKVVNGDAMPQTRVEIAAWALVPISMPEKQTSKIAVSGQVQSIETAKILDVQGTIARKFATVDCLPLAITPLPST